MLGTYAIAEKILLLILDVMANRIYKQRVAVVLYMELRQQNPFDVKEQVIQRGYITHLLRSRFTWLASSSVSMVQNTRAGQLVTQALE